jgi:hypothetical protein
MSTLTIHLPNDLQEQIEDWATERGERVEEFIAILLREAVDAGVEPETRRLLTAAELVALADKWSETRPPLSDEQWSARFKRVQEAMLRQAIANGTAIEEEDEERFLEEG